ncbi:MAG: ribosome biogenesis GTPase Der [Bacillota bacterium]
MPRKYVVAIVGRPNVGKSALFNRMVGASASIVHSQSGVTRDRLYGTVRWQGRAFTLLDTGGLDLVSEDDLVRAIKAQVEQALKEADALLFVVDVRAGLTPGDLEVAEYLRKTRKPLVLVANKVDVQSREDRVLEFHRLGFDKVVPVSAAHGLGVGDLLDLVSRLLVEAYGEELVPIRDDDEEEADRAEEAAEALTGAPEDWRLDARADSGPGELPQPVSPDATGRGPGAAIRVAIVGKPNVGKSSLTNALLKDQRMTVSKMPGTTIDAVDTPFSWDGRDFVLVDTAGLRRPKVIGEKLEELSVGRALSAVKRADVCLLVLDGSEAPSAQERRIAGYIRRNARASAIIVNKTDLGIYAEASRAQFKAAVLHECRPINYSEVLFVSCLTGAGIDKVLPEVVRLYEQFSRRIETSLLNQVVGEITGISPPPKEARFYYATQVGERPPQVLFFVKDPTKVTEMYQRYVENELRKRFDMKGVPIVMEFRERQRRKRK